MSIFNEQLIEIFNIQICSYNDVLLFLKKHNIRINIYDCNYVLYICFELNEDNFIINKFKFDYEKDIECLIEYGRVIFENKEYLLEFFKDFKNNADPILISNAKLSKIKSTINNIKLSSKVDDNSINYELIDTFLKNYTFNNIQFTYVNINELLPLRSIGIRLPFVDLMSKDSVPLSICKYLTYNDALRKRMNQLQVKTLKSI
jgi:hypothetical protein